MTTPSGDGGEPGPKRQPHTLRQAASAVFALTAVLPLLLFVWTVHHLGALSKLPAQLGLGLALAVALLGFCVFRRLMGQMSDLIVALRRVVEHGERSAARTSVEAPGGAAQRAAETRARGAVSPAPASRPPAEPALLDAAEHTGGTAPPHAPATPGPPLASPTVGSLAAEGWSRRAAETDTVPGLGAIQEVHDLSRAMAVLWQAEAAAYKGQRVVVFVLNAAQPTIGTLIGLTDDGLLLQAEDGSERVAVSYSRISAIDATESSAS